MEADVLLDDKNIMVMKLLHYFITEKNYNPIILQGVENEIWLENLHADYKVVRIVSGYIHNDEQFDFDKFKTKRIVKKIKRKTFSLNINVLSIFLNLGDNVTENLEDNKSSLCVKINEEKDFSNSKLLQKIFPDMSKKLTYSESGVELFVKITNDINDHNKKDAKRMEDVFKIKKPYITYGLILINILVFVYFTLFDNYPEVVNRYCMFAPLIRNGEYYRLLTCMFFHADIVHLGLNCYALYVIGTQMENYIGRAKFTIVYIVSGIMGALFSMIFAGNNFASIGASGAIFGLLGSLLYFGYYYRVYLGNVLKSQIIPLIIINLGLGFFIEGIDIYSHIGGLIGGVLTTMALGIKNKSTTFEKVNGYIILGLFIAFEVYMAFFYL